MTILGFFYKKYYIDTNKPILEYTPNNFEQPKDDKTSSKTLDYIPTKSKINIKKQDPPEDLVFIDIGIDGKKVGRIVIKLFSDVVPITCKNFRTLCNNNNNISYINTPFHRIINNFMIQGGDFEFGNGTGGKSIYGHKFNDENFIIPHDQPYLLSMANSGPNTNGSQFFITTEETPHLDGKHVVFGKVINWFNIIDQLNNIETGNNDKPNHNVYIFDSGIIQ